MSAVTQKSPYVKGSTAALFHTQNRLMNRLVWFVGIIMVFLVGLSIAQVVLLANLHASGAMVARTTESTTGMRRDLQALQERLTTWTSTLVGDLPQDELKGSARKVLGIVDNLHELSSRMAHVTPAQLDSVLRNTNEITERVSSALGGVDGTRARTVFQRAGELLSSVSPSMVVRLFSSISEVADHVAQLGEDASKNNMTARVSEALDTLQSIGRKLEELHELTIKI